MNHNELPSDDSWESDAVWNLLEQAPPRTASSRFAADTVRATKLLVEPDPWWKRLLSPAPLAGFAAATAAVTLGVLSLVNPTPAAGPQTVSWNSQQAVAIQEIAETETLMVAVEQLDDFSDNELVSLIGF